MSTYSLTYYPTYQSTVAVFGGCGETSWRSYDAFMVINAFPWDDGAGGTTKITRSGAIDFESLAIPKRAIIKSIVFSITVTCSFTHDSNNAFISLLTGEQKDYANNYTQNGTLQGLILGGTVLASDVLFGSTTWIVSLNSSCFETIKQNSGWFSIGIYMDDLEIDDLWYFDAGNCSLTINYEMAREIVCE